jgi:ATP phosphoribosyltransferase
VRAARPAHTRAHTRRRVFLPASDIPAFVGKGDVDLGITGHDVVLEAQMQGDVTEVLRLGFGRCALQVQAPDGGPVRTAADLAGKRVVTSFEVLAARFFAEIDDAAGLTGAACTQIAYVGGSVEAACALGLADGIGARRVRVCALAIRLTPACSRPRRCAPHRMS